MRNFTTSEYVLAEVKHRLLLMLMNVREDQRIFKIDHKYASAEFETREATLLKILETIADVEAGVVLDDFVGEVE